MARNLLVTVAVAVLVSATTAGAAAVIDGGDVVNGSLTGKDVRNKSLTRRDFRGSVRGPRGFQGREGQQGVPGQKGDTGPRGPSDMFTAFIETGSLPVRSSNDPPAQSWVATLDSLPTGQFFVAGNLVARNTSPSTALVRCEIEAFWASGVVDSTQATLPAGAYAALAFSGPGEQQTSQTPRGFGLYCAANAESGAGGGEVNLSDLDLDAVQVGAWH
jgi:hypothetical protein